MIYKKTATILLSSLISITGHTQEVKNYTSADWIIKVTTNLFSDKDDAEARIIGSNGNGEFRVWCDGERPAWGTYFIFNRDISAKYNMISAREASSSVTARVDSGEVFRIEGKSSSQSGRILYLPQNTYRGDEQKEEVSRLKGALFPGQVLSLRVVGRRFQPEGRIEVIDQFSLNGFTNAVRFIGNTCGIDLEKRLNRAP